MKNNDGIIKLSPSALNLYKECPRCFWLEKNAKIKRPRGIFPSLPGGMDSVIKNYFDKYRIRKMMPPELINRINGKLYDDLMKLQLWRSWRGTDLSYTDPETNTILSGAIDDLLMDEGIGGTYFIPLDYKTRGTPLKEDPAKYYQTQLDCYCLILEDSGYQVADYAYLLYYWPEESQENGIFKFAVEPFKIKTNTESAKKIVKDATDCLNSEIPENNTGCEYCRYRGTK